MLKTIQTAITYLKAWSKKKKELKADSFFLWLLIELAEIIFFILPLVLLFRHFIFQASYVFSGSMYPTLKVQDRLIVNKFIYYFSDPKRGQIVLFKSPHGDKRQFVKRLVGLPGETVEIKRGTVYINGKQLLFPGINIQHDLSQFGPKKIPYGHYFVLGDNRGNSLDSRSWGYVKRKDFIGKALFTFWPMPQIELLR